MTIIETLKLPPTLEETICGATMAHQGQVDKRGEPCILHVLRVGLESGPDPINMTIGFLHDIVEDTNVKLMEILKNYGPEVYEAVDAITRRPEETYFEYIARCARNKRARFVKMVDLVDNMAPWRQDFKGALHLMDQHQKAYDYLMQGTIDAITEETLRK